METCNCGKPATWMEMSSEYGASMLCDACACSSAKSGNVHEATVWEFVSLTDSAKVSAEWIAQFDMVEYIGDAFMVTQITRTAKMEKCGTISTNLTIEALNLEGDTVEYY